jgi:hypothetical protein
LSTGVYTSPPNANTVAAAAASAIGAPGAGAAGTITASAVNNPSSSTNNNNNPNGVDHSSTNPSNTSSTNPLANASAAARELLAQQQQQQQPQQQHTPPGSGVITGEWGFSAFLFLLLFLSMLLFSSLYVGSVAPLCYFILGIVSVSVFRCSLSGWLALTPRLILSFPFPCKPKKLTFLLSFSLFLL